MIKIEEMTGKNDFTVGSWLITSDQFHPIWNQWILSCITLRGECNGKSAVKQSCDKTHEISVLSLDPKTPVKFDAVQGEVRFLTPPDQVLQIARGNDAEARETAEYLVDLINMGRLSPDSDYRFAWERILGVKTFYAK